jgi:hypothetical protein
MTSTTKSVGILTRLRAVGSEVRKPAAAVYISSPPNLQDSPETLPLYYSRAKNLFPVGIEQGRDFDYSLLFSTKVKNEWSLFLQSLYSLVACIIKTLPSLVLSHISNR